MNGTTSMATISLEQVLSNALDGVFVVDRRRRYVHFNAGCERITGYRSTEVLGRDCQCGEMVSCRDDYGRPLWGALCPTREVFDGTRDSARQRMQLRRKDGIPVWVETIYTPVRDQNGHVECVLGVIRDMSESKTREDELRDEFLTALQEAREASSQPSSSELTHSTTVPIQHDLHLSCGDTGDSSLELDRAIESVERAVISKALRAANWHRNKAAELMGISRSRLYRRMEALGINPNDHA